MKTKIEFNGQIYNVLPEDKDMSGVGSVQDLAEDFAFDVATELNLRYGTAKFNEVVMIVRKAVFALIRNGLLPAFIEPSRNLPMVLPPQNKEVLPLWIS